VLAVVLSARGAEVDPAYAEKVTRAGADPVGLGAEIPVLFPHWIEGGDEPATRFFNFPLEEGQEDPLGLVETFSLHTVTPKWDEGRGLWFADLFLIEPWSDYRPFLHLRVGRLQPWGIRSPDLDLRLSEVVAVAPTQLMSSRTVEVRRGEQATVDVSLRAGPAYFPSVRVEAMLEQRVGEEDDPLAWRQLGDPVALDATGAWDDRSWVGSLDLPPGNAAMRLRVDEYEVFPGEAGEDAVRLAYTDAVNLV
jgi:hypothetical protein